MGAWRSTEKFWKVAMRKAARDLVFGIVTASKETSTIGQPSANICRMAFRWWHITCQCAGTGITAESDLPPAQKSCPPVNPLLVLLGLATEFLWRRREPIVSA
jgi:hypothetical protein